MQQSEPIVHIALRPSEVHLVLAALAELPFKVSAVLYSTIQVQMDRQLNPGPQLVKDPEPVETHAP